MNKGYKATRKHIDENKTGKKAKADLPYCAQVAKCIPGRTGPTRQASQSGLKEDVGRGMGEGHMVSAKLNDENETGKIRIPIYLVMQKRQSAFRDTPDNPEQLVNQN